MATKKDFYEVLGLSKGASEDEIKKAYRKKAMQYHPDKVSQGTEAEKKEAEKNFKEINEAYQVLSDPQKKQQYDQFGHAAFEQGGGQGYGGGGFGGFGGFSGDDLGDIFGSFFGGNGGFGGGGRRRGPEPGEDLQYAVEITLEEAARGCEKTIKYTRNGKCGTCGGTGAKANSKMNKCSKCNGTGKIETIQRTMLGNFRSEAVCDTCHGTGKIPEEKCGTCNGKRIVKETINQKVKIPAGISTGQKLRMTGLGEASHEGGPNGDLYIVIRVAQHEIFEREGNDLYCQIPISYCVATLGGEIDVPTLNGKKTMKIPEGTQSGQKFSMKEEGIQNINSHRKGNLIIEVMVEIPVGLNAEQKELLQAFEDSLKDKNHKQKKTFFDKIKKMFS